MCLLCRKEYNEKTTKISCCSNVTEIPFLPNLKTLYCFHTNITEIPLLPNLKTLCCSWTKITEIPLLPNLTALDCSNTKITELPKITNCKMYYTNCRWLKKMYEDNGKLKDFILLED